MDLSALRQSVEALRPRFESDLQRLVDLDCGSHDKTGVDAAGRIAQERLEGDGWTVERLPHDVYGDTLVATKAGSRAGHVVLMAHLDTVFDTGEAARRPYRVEDGIAYGPGVCDCKAGVLAGVTAVAALDGDHPRLTFLLTPDEEIGSPSSRAHIQALAKDADVALCLEGARANGDFVVARKGVVDLVVEIEGRAAHAGIEPEKGINAALDAALTTVALQDLNGRWPGVTVNVGVIRAGSRPNVVCPSARLEVDVRAVDQVTFADAVAEVEKVAAQPRVPGVTKTVTRAAEHPPMQQSDDRLADLALRLAGDLGITTRPCTTGGAADANTTSALGVPTLDGLGPVGGDDHAPSEYLELGSVVPRVTLLAALVRDSPAALSI